MRRGLACVIVVLLVGCGPSIADRIESAEAVVKAEKAELRRLEKEKDSAFEKWRKYKWPSEMLLRLAETSSDGPDENKIDEHKKAIAKIDEEYRPRCDKLTSLVVDQEQRVAAAEKTLADLKSQQK